MDTKPPLPPFTPETARHKVRMAEDAWNTRDPDRVVLVYTEDTRWRNRAEFPAGREQVRQFLQRKWARELDYRLIKELWTCQDNRIAVRFAPQDTPLTGTGAAAPGMNRFSFDPTATGPGYVWHCHILDHEDNEMMRPYLLKK